MRAIRPDRDGVEMRHPVRAYPGWWSKGRLTSRMDTS
jgi:hypothetical protein